MDVIRFFEQPCDETDKKGRISAILTALSGHRDNNANGNQEYVNYLA